MTVKYDRKNIEDVRLRIPNYTKIRNLKQYASLSDDEFNEIWEKKITGVEQNSEFESRIRRKMDEFAKDYDLDDLKINDRLVLRALVQAIISLEDFENHLYNFRVNGIDEADVIKLDKITNLMSGLRDSISKMQNDLKITRRIRKGDREESTLAFLENLKLKAKEFYESRMSYIWCPKCRMLLCTAWLLYPEEAGNVFSLVCRRPLQNGEICGEKIKITSKELMSKRGINIDDVPDYFK